MRTFDTGASISSFALVAALVWGLASCGQEVSSPEPKINKGGDKGAATPAFRCSAQEDRWVEVRGENFTPLVIGSLEEDGPNVSWPAVRLQRVEDMEGNEVEDGREVTIQAEGKLVRKSDAGSTNTQQMALDAADGGDGTSSDTSSDDAVGGDTSDSSTADAEGDAVGGDAGSDAGEDAGGDAESDAGGDTGGMDTGPGEDTAVADTGGEDTGAGGDAGAADADASDDAGRERHLVWLSDAKLRFKVTPEMNLKGGKYDLTVLSAREPQEGKSPNAAPAANSKKAEAPKAFGILPPPTVEEVAGEAPVCVASEQRTVTITGQNFLKRERDGEDPLVPTVDVGDREFRPTVSDCTELDGPFSGYQRCTTLEVELPQEAFPASPKRLEVENIEPAECHNRSGREPGLRVVDPPTVVEAEPDPICAAGNDHTVEISGEGFIETPDGAPTVEIGDFTAQNVQLEDCSELTGDVADGTEICSTIRAEVPAGDVGGPGSGVSRSDVVVTNPGQANCSSSGDTQLTSVAPPAISTIAPQPVTGPKAGSSDGDTRDVVRLGGDRFAQVDGVRPEVTVWLEGERMATSMTYSATAVGACREVNGPGNKRVNLCGELKFEIPEGDFEVPSGQDQAALKVSVTNPEPLQCASDVDSTEDLVLVDPPELASVETTPICTATQSKRVRLEGEGFIFRDGGGPQVAVGMSSYPATRASGANCTEIASQESDTTVEECDAIRFQVGQADLRTTNYDVTVYNPTSAGGFTTESGDAQTLTELGPPRVQEVEPELTCLEDGTRTLTFRGQGFLRAEPTGMSGTTSLPTVNFSGTQATVTDRSLSECGSPLNVPGTPMRDYVKCKRMEVTLDTAGQTGIAQATIRNPAPADCSARSVDVTIDPEPTVTNVRVAPQSSCNDNGYRRIEVSGRTFLSAQGRLPTVTIGSKTYEPLSAQNCTRVQTVNHSQLRYCGSLIVYGKTSDVDGTREVSVENPMPSGCSSANPGQPTQTFNVTQNCP